MPVCRLNLLILLTVLLVVLLTSCSPVPSATPAPTTALPILPSATSPPTQTSTATASPTPPPTATLTPEPSATPRPHYDLHDMRTWPEEMRNYYSRSPEEWSNPNRQYISDAEFDMFIHQARRDLLAENSINTSGMSDEEVMTEYQRWSFESKQTMVWTPSEIVHYLNGPHNIAYIDGTERDSPVHGGNNFISRFREFPPQNIIDFVNNLTYDISVFNMQVTRQPNGGLFGLLAGTVQIPGVNPQDEVLMWLSYREAGVDYFDLVSIPFVPTAHETGQNILSSHGEVIQITEFFTLPPAVNGLCAGGIAWCQNPLLTLSDLVNNFGTTTVAMPYYASEDDMGGLLTAGDLNEYGIERAYSIELNAIPLTDLSLPWVD